MGYNTVGWLQIFLVATASAAQIYGESVTLPILNRAVGKRSKVGRQTYKIRVKGFRQVFLHLLLLYSNLVTIGG